jgi:hypothetical protein
MKLVTELNQFIKLIAPDAKRETFEESCLDEICDELNT